ncbi:MULTISPECIES: DUF433 domain-containing protein [Aurantimonadaceae]|uniref:DUF433 domain-containing protein n=1 Tax=Aurantimonadaceae TaxID=255475 RepID=UPI000321C802|nr:DUF433 domain-containing protein [Fulvimarina sp.]
MPARTILAYLQAGRSDVEIFEDYPTLPAEGVRAVRAWTEGLGSRVRERSRCPG